MWSNLIHEIGHIVGLWHEHSKCDRDQYVKIKWKNIAEQHRHNFRRKCKSGEKLTSYDFGSIMHYGPYGFSRNGKKTIIQLKTGPFVANDALYMGQRKRLSGKDILGVQRRYAPYL